MEALPAVGELVDVASVPACERHLIDGVDDLGSLAMRAAAVAADQSAPRQTYASVYRAFCAASDGAFLGV